MPRDGEIWEDDLTLALFDDPNTPITARIGAAAIAAALKAARLLEVEAEVVAVTINLTEKPAADEPSSCTIGYPPDLPTIIARMWLSLQWLFQQAGMDVDLDFDTFRRQHVRPMGQRRPSAQRGRGKRGKGPRR